MPNVLKTALLLGLMSGLLLVVGEAFGGAQGFMTMFLFVVDILWIRILSFQPVPGVLQIDPQREKQKQLVNTDW